MSKSWYILHTYTGYEAKIERAIRSLIEKKDIDSSIVCDVRVPVEEIVEQKDGKQRVRKNKFLPGYLMLELDLPEIDWKKTCSAIRAIQGVTGFVGTEANERPRPITSDEAKNLLQRSGAIKGERPVRVKASFSLGDEVKITDGPFATFTGTVEEVNADKERLRVNVQIFGRATPVEIGMAQVEKVVK